MCSIDWGIVAELVNSLAWPVALLVSLTFVAFSGTIRRLLLAPVGMVRKVSVPGMDIEIDAAKSEAISKLLETSIDELIAKSNREYTRFAKAMQIRSLIKSVLDSKRLIEFAQDRDKPIRATVHVNDIVFEDQLCQLVDYYPQGTGALRRFSMRYGIIGVCWRLQESRGETDTFKRLEDDDGDPKRNMILEWGMTQEEAERVVSHKKQSILCIILRDPQNQLPVGILYVDATGENVFGDDNAATSLASAIEGDPTVASLSEKVRDMMLPLRAAGPNLLSNR